MINSTKTSKMFPLKPPNCWARVIQAALVLSAHAGPPISLLLITSKLLSLLPGAKGHLWNKDTLGSLVGQDKNTVSSLNETVIAQL